jgi:pSer/pThr/pTyr-binding forkhead associated (FHA) protein
MEGYTGFALRFLSGKYEGSEYPLKSNQEINIGRGAGFELVLIEDMVSRHHARLITTLNAVSIQDMNSTNGTFVNGERVRRASLNDGDRILVGTAILQVVPLSEETLRLFEEDSDDSTQTNDEAPAVNIDAPASQAALNPPALPVSPSSSSLQAPISPSSPSFLAPSVNSAPIASAPAASPAPAAYASLPVEDDPFLTYEEEHGGQPMMSGDYSDTPLSDLLELFASTRKSGVLVLSREKQEGRLHLRSGRLASVGYNGRKTGNLKKMALRIMAWTEADFAFYPPNDTDIRDTIDENPAQLLRTAQRNAEKLRKYREAIPEDARVIELCRPMTAPLRDLRPDYLDLIQQVFNYSSLEQLSDQSSLSDVDLYQRLAFLIRSGYLQVH